ncbi:hypothetical protein [Bacteroides gallinarum]|uniref:hypothetical protein n=1 Tax=Bacteroides gallinarum TaxID=376806 RepID=UPI00037CB82C|nr:hypothetical protein [Bacteroides gallinarum]
MTTSKHNISGYILTFVFLWIGTSMHAQEKEPAKYWKVELTGAVNTYDGWEVEPSITYQPIRYIGLTMGLLFCNPINQSGFIGESQDKQWYWNAVDDDNGSYLFALRPSLQFTSPAIWLGADKEYALSFSISPGITMPLPSNREFNIEYFPQKEGAWTAFKTEHVKNKDATLVYYHLKSALSLEIDDSIILSMGYTLSNFDLYGGSRNIVIEGKKLNPERYRLMHSFFVGIGYRF